MFKNLGCGHIGVKANQMQALEYAEQFGFEACSPHLDELEKMSSSELNELLACMKEKGLKWGAAGLPVDFRTDDAAYEAGMANLPRQARVLCEAGVNRMATWILPGDNEISYLENFERHRKRLTPVAKTLEGEGIRFGLEFVGPRTSKNMFRYPFASTQKGMLELCDAIGTDNIGLLLDCWHWHTSSGTVEELLTLTNEQIAEVHVNDAQRGIPTDELMDLERQLPTTTGVIDLKGFMGALSKIGYDGPISCEPFDAELNAMENEPALEKTIAALNALFALV